MPTSDHGFPVTDLSDEQLAQLRRDVLHEQSLRRRLDASPEKIEHAIAEYQQATGRGQGEPWEQPTGPLNAYRRGAVVEHEGEFWRSTVANNVWAPSVSGWRLKPETDEDGNEVPPPYVPPTGAHDSYQEGERITHNGQVWEAVRSGVVHSPDEYAPDWRLVEEDAEPEPEPEPEPPEDEEPTDPEEPEPGDGEGDEDDEPTEPEEPEPEPDEPAPAEWVQPAGGHDAYNTGDRVTFEGSIYVSVMDGNVWSPTDYSAGWERQE